MSDSQPAGAICLDCGICCDGTLHGHTIVRTEDEDVVRALGLEIVEEQGKRQFDQPCAHFCGTCGVYENRPPVCRRYRCALLKRVEAGDLSADEADDRIKTALKLRTAVVGSAPAAKIPAARARLAIELKESLPTLEGEDRTKAARLLLNLVALDEHLARWFREERAPEEKSRG